MLPQRRTWLQICSISLIGAYFVMVTMNKSHHYHSDRKWIKNAKIKQIKLSKLVEQRLTRLQNPIDCRKARKILCQLTHDGCGFACQIHHAAFCLIMAYGTNRTLIYKTEGMNYVKSGFDGIFMPLSKNCTDWVSEPHYLWPARKEDQIVKLGVYRDTPDKWVAIILLQVVVLKLIRYRRALFWASYGLAFVSCNILFCIWMTAFRLVFEMLSFALMQSWSISVFRTFWKKCLTLRGRSMQTPYLTHRKRYFG